MTTVVVCGCAGALPVAGVALHYLQFCLGLRDMGIEVSYLEEIDYWPYHPDRNEPDEDASYTIPWLRELFEAFEMPWAYRDPKGQCHGATDAEIRARCAAADLILNVSGSHHLVEHHRTAKVLAYVDTDPGFVQVKAAQDAGTRDWLLGHDVLFTFGEAMGTPACKIPDAGLEWKLTRQPVHLPFWTPAAQTMPGTAYTTVMNWRAYAPVTWNGEEWGQKDAEFPVIRPLPTLVPDAHLELAIGGDGAPLDDLRAEGWKLADPLEATRTVWRFRDFIASSRAELTIAKQCYVRSGSGWFSERSANYLAGGRPVVAQDTGWSACLPQGKGALGFTTTEEAADAIRAVEADPEGHSRAARELAETYFDAPIVLEQLLSDAGVD